MRTISKSHPTETVVAGVTESVLLSNRQVHALFWLAAVLVVINWFNVHESYAIETQLGYGLTAFGALLPLLLWSRGMVPGIPVFPAFVFFQFMAFGMPLLSQHPGITVHSPQDHLDAGAIVAAALLSGTAGWLLAGNRLRPKVASCRQLNETGGERILIASIFLDALLDANNIYDWIDIPSGIFSILRGILGGVSTLALFVISKHWGSGELKNNLKWVFLFAVILNFFIQVTTLLLISAISVACIAIGGFTLGSRRPPWLAIGLFIALIAFLHQGKAPVRANYWGPNRESLITSVDETFEMYRFWFDSSVEAMQEGGGSDEQEEKVSAFQRASLMHLFLYEKSMINNGLDLMLGSTYVIIPELLIPRFIHPDKPWSLEGTSRLNIHFGIQTREETMVTTIGWGLFNEGFANFGFWGVVVLGFLAGAAAGAITYYSQGYPFLSLRSLTTILVVSSSFQTEHTMAVLVTSLFQSYVGLLAFGLVFMKDLPTREWILFVTARAKKTGEAKKRNLAV
ncbi:MAG: hypothetical protein SFU85_05700 [Candidatus Methylacidiphilales bacterium]|nr:hypothetical protein [Candidatus Methylacidiphilales bacterium]